jgi:hypothetical protein
VWRSTAVKAGQPSDPFLMTGFDKKVLHLKVTDANCTGTAEFMYT